MRAVIGDTVKSDIIKQWLSGKSRDAITQITGTSAGVVSKVVATWKTALGIPVAEEMRELAVGLRKLGLSPSECAIGARVFKVMRSLGLYEEEHVQEFLSNTYRQAKELGIQPETLASNLKQLTHLFESVPISEIPIYLMQKAQEKVDLEREIERLRSEQLNAKKLAEDALSQHGITVSELRNYLKFKREMAYSGIPVDGGITNIMNLLDVIRKTTNFHPAMVLSKFRTVDQVDLAQIELNQLKNEINQLREEKDAHMQVLKIYRELESSGFGLKEIRLLRNTIREIASDNGVSPGFAVTQFFSNIEEDYDAVLGFKSKLERTRSDIQDLELKRAAIQNQPYRLDWALLFKLLQEGQGQVQVQQGQTRASSQENLQTPTDNAAEYGSSFLSDPNNDDATTPIRKEIENSREKSKTENEEEPSDEQVRLSQENSQSKYKLDHDFNLNAALPTQNTKNSSQEQSKFNGDRFIDLQKRLLQKASEAVSRKNVIYNYNDKDKAIP